MAQWHSQNIKNILLIFNFDEHTIRGSSPGAGAGSGDAGAAGGAGEGAGAAEAAGSVLWFILIWAVWRDHGQGRLFQMGWNGEIEMKISTNREIQMAEKWSKTHLLSKKQTKTCFSKLKFVEEEWAGIP